MCSANLAQMTRHLSKNLDRAATCLIAKLQMTLGDARRNPLACASQLSKKYKSTYRVSVGWRSPGSRNELDFNSTDDLNLIRNCFV